MNPSPAAQSLWNPVPPREVKPESLPMPLHVHSQRLPRNPSSFRLNSQTLVLKLSSVETHKTCLAGCWTTVPAFLKKGDESQVTGQLAMTLTLLEAQFLMSMWQSTCTFKWSVLLQTPESTEETCQGSAKHPTASVPRSHGGLSDSSVNHMLLSACRLLPQALQCSNRNTPQLYQAVYTTAVSIILSFPIIY